MAALVTQHFTTLIGRQPSAALLRSILLNTAGDAGQPGPDAKFGFGIANPEAAVALISARMSAQNTTFVEGIVRNGGASNFTFIITTNGIVRATLNWMDPAGNPGAAKALVNDLDLELVSPTGATFFPFSLSADSPSAVATGLGREHGGHRRTNRDQRQRSGHLDAAGERYVGRRGASALRAGRKRRSDQARRGGGAERLANFGAFTAWPSPSAPPEAQGRSPNTPGISAMAHHKRDPA